MDRNPKPLAIYDREAVQALLQQYDLQEASERLGVEPATLRSQAERWQISRRSLPWTEWEKQTLIHFRRRGKSLKSIARSLLRTPQGVYNQLHRMDACELDQEGWVRLTHEVREFLLRPVPCNYILRMAERLGVPLRRYGTRQVYTNIEGAERVAEALDQERWLQDGFIKMNTARRRYGLHEKTIRRLIPQDVHKTRWWVWVREESLRKLKEHLATPPDWVMVKPHLLQRGYTRGQSDKCIEWLKRRNRVKVIPGKGLKAYAHPFWIERWIEQHKPRRRTSTTPD
jgi:hypothetical protein